MSSPFKFKQFAVEQDQCAMKIGTDGVVLGAWVLPKLKYEPRNILDVGTGTGVISLMLAQRFASSEVEAIEIDEKAYEQAVSNFENSPWGDRMFGYHASFQEYFEEVNDEKYDLIVSNPPGIPTSEANLMPTRVKDFEPSIALFVANEDSLLFYRTIADFAIQHLAPNGYLFFETNEFNANRVGELLKAKGFQEVRIEQDMSGKDRMILCRIKN